MSLRNYLTSKVFFIQMLIALAILAVLGYLFMHWITYTTQHGHEITVPDLRKLSEQQVEEGATRKGGPLFASGIRVRVWDRVQRALARVPR